MKEVAVNEVPTGAQLIDVRETDEYAEVRAQGAVNIPMSEFVGRIDEIDLDRDVYVICKLGGRSAQVAEYLEQRGIEAINVNGGTDGWVAAGLPTEA
ncbi:rhodanese-like domain-containing protein [Corynebacterium crudilactis]|uniref:Sulfurtransferase n=1 Tax=Corynebacterium crudilactis TaxID=1652495 RepID=A0A172QW62_9CORY|nr:rhodanese-like domain-containing protein [Corynebacterium crudilactis]ANE04886.1 sulfurtransferase [Corynebacterium crudilactis]